MSILTLNPYLLLATYRNLLERSVGFTQPSSTSRSYFGAVLYTHRYISDLKQNFFGEILLGLNPLLGIYYHLGNP